MSVYFVYRCPYIAPAGKHLKRFDDDTVLDWFRKRWHRLADTDYKVVGDRMMGQPRSIQRTSVLLSSSVSGLTFCPTRWTPTASSPSRSTAAKRANPLPQPASQGTAADTVTAVGLPRQARSSRVSAAPARAAARVPPSAGPGSARGVCHFLAELADPPPPLNPGENRAVVLLLGGVCQFADSHRGAAARGDGEARNEVPRASASGPSSLADGAAVPPGTKP